VLTGCYRPAEAVAEYGAGSSPRFKPGLPSWRSRSGRFDSHVFAAGGKAVFLTCDVTVATQAAALVDTAMAQFGRVDGAVASPPSEDDPRPDRTRKVPRRRPRSAASGVAVLVVQAVPAAGLVATQRRAVKPLEHAPEGIHATGIGRVGVIDTPSSIAKALIPCPSFGGSLGSEMPSYSGYFSAGVSE